MGTDSCTTPVSYWIKPLLLITAVLKNKYDTVQHTSWGTHIREYVSQYCFAVRPVASVRKVCENKTAGMENTMHNILVWLTDKAFSVENVTSSGS